jgi:hypothetical protein
MNMAGGVTGRNLDAAIFAMEHGIPLDKNILPFIHVMDELLKDPLAPRLTPANFFVPA